MSTDNAKKSGSTLSQDARALRGYRNRTFSMLDTTSALIDRLAERLGTTRGGAIVYAVGAALEALARENDGSHRRSSR